MLPLKLGNYFTRNGYNDVNEMDWYDEIEVNDKLVGCGALKFLEKDHGEFKSIRVLDQFRKRGYGYKILSHLIEEAKKLNIKKLSLETGAGDFFYQQENYLKKLGLRSVIHLLITSLIQTHVI